MNLNKADIIAIEKEACKRSLSTFVQRAWHVLEPATELKWGWCLDAICEHLEAISRGELKKDLLMNVPPGSMKSLLTCVFWPAWEWGAFGKPHLRIIGTAHAEKLAIRDTRKCRNLIKSQWYQSRWEVVVSQDQDGKKEFGNTSHGVRNASAFTSITGERGDRVILDDPIGAFDANSEAKLEAARLAFTETLPTRVNNKDSRIVVIMQRLSEKDTSGIILSEEYDYEHLCIPMRYESNNTKVTSLGWEDPRTKDGELMFPERFPEDQVVELEKKLGSYGAAGQLQQRPSPRGGGLFKEKWFGKYEYEIPRLKYRIITVDTAMKDGQQNDYNVMDCWGCTEIGQAILLDKVKKKMEIPELLTTLRDFINKQQSDPRPIMQQAPLRGTWVEDKVSGTTVIQTLRREGKTILAISRSKGNQANDKYSRACNVVPDVESGHVILPAMAPYYDDLINTICTFPAGANDDDVDTMVDAVEIIRNNAYTTSTTENQHSYGSAARANHW